MARKLVDVLEEQGMSLNLQAGGEAPKEMVDREVKEGATERAAKLKDIYLQTLSSVTCEVRVLTKLAREWVGKSVDDVGHRYEQMVPEYPIKEAVMRSLICMFDSGYTLPQGREVINYFYPLQYGYDGLIKMCEEGIAETAGRPDGDGIIGMSRLYFYEAVKLVLEGIQTWHLHYADEAKRLAATEKNAKQKKEYEEIAEIMEHIAHKQPRNFREALQMS